MTLINSKAANVNNDQLYSKMVQSHFMVQLAQLLHTLRHKEKLKSFYNINEIKIQTTIAPNENWPNSVLEK